MEGAPTSLLIVLAGGQPETDGNRLDEPKYCFFRPLEWYPSKKDHIDRLQTC